MALSYPASCKAIHGSYISDPERRQSRLTPV
jgi:hypothetical protein